MDCKEIIKKYLVDNGFDGLQHDQECGCKLNDLICCEEDCSDCTPAYLADCKKCDECNNCDLGYCLWSGKI